MLPCDLAPPAAASSSAPGNESVEAMYSVYLVLWYREDQGEPLYRYIHYGTVICYQPQSHSLDPLASIPVNVNVPIYTKGAVTVTEVQSVHLKH